MARNVVGLDIGTTAVRAAELSTRRASTVLERFGQVAMPLGAVTDGEVTNPDAAAAAIKELWRQVRFSSKHVILGVANQRVVVRLVDLPWMEVDELRRSLRFQVQEYIPIPVDDAELDFNVLGEHEAGGGQRLMRVLLVAAQKDMIAGHLRSCQLAGLEPVGIDLTPFALMRALHPGGEILPEAGEALIDVGARVTNIVVQEHGLPRFVRILLMGGQDITDALRQALALDQDAAERAKLDATTAAIPDVTVSRIVEQKVGAFVEEVRSSLDFYRAQADGVPLSQVVLSGGGSRLWPLAERLRSALRLPVQAGRALESLQVGRIGLAPEQLLELEPIAAVPVGLALGGVS